MIRKNLLTLFICLIGNFAFSQLDLQLSDKIYFQPMEELYFQNQVEKLTISYVQPQEKTENEESFFKPDDIFVGLSLIYAYDGLGKEDEDNKTTYISLSPSLWYFFNSKLAIIGQLGYTTRRSKYTLVDEDIINSNSSYSMSAYMRYHLFCSSRIALFSQIGFSLALGNEKRNEGLEDTKTNRSTFAPELEVGAIYHLSSRAMLYTEFGGLSYRLFRRKPESGDVSTTSSVELAFFSRGISLGFVYNLNGSHKPNIE